MPHNTECIWKWSSITRRNEDVCCCCAAGWWSGHLLGRRAFRRLTRDYERLATTQAGYHWFAFAMLLLKSVFAKSA